MKLLRILVLEDEPVLALLLARVLEGMGHSVCAIEAGAEGAVQAATQEHPDLVLADMRLANGCGVSAMEAILRIWPVPHVFISGDTEAVLARRPGAVVLRKPVRVEELAWAMQRACDPPGGAVMAG